MKTSIQSFIHTIILVLILGSTAFAQFKLPEYETFTLDNGLTVYLMEKKDVPLISFSAVFDGGVIKDGSTSGIASFTVEALTIWNNKLLKVTDRFSVQLLRKQCQYLCHR